MARRHYVNNAPTHALNGGINSSTTTVVVDAASGLPATFPYLACIDIQTASAEMVLVTAAASTTLTVTRNADGQGAFSHLTAATFSHVAAAADYDEANAHVNASSGVHGITGSVVGTTDTQTLSNKTFTAFTATANSGVVGITVTGDGTGDLLDLKKNASVVAKVDQAGNLTAQTATVTSVTSSGAVSGTNISASGTLGVTGASTLASAGVTGNATVGGTLGVTGTTTVAALNSGNHAVTGTLSTSGLATLASASVTGNATVGGTLAVTGAVTASSSLAVTGNASAAKVTGRLVAPQYTNEAARDAAIASPTAGEIISLTAPTTGLAAVARQEVYLGSSWAPVYHSRLVQGISTVVDVGLTAAAGGARTALSTSITTSGPAIIEFECFVTLITTAVGAAGTVALTLNGTDKRSIRWHNHSAFGTNMWGGTAKLQVATAGTYTVVATVNNDSGSGGTTTVREVNYEIRELA